MVFCGMTSNVLKMTMGADLTCPKREQDLSAERLAAVPALVIVLVIITGLSMIINCSALTL
jgi:hypothetical protein